MEVSKLFDNILDLPGIEGVCLFGSEGQMYINRLPSFLSNELFADAQRRIVAMYETMDENFLPCDDYLLKFSERWLLLRRTEKHVMLILGGEKANLASTRMVTNMTLKHLTPELVAQLEAAATGGMTRVTAQPAAAAAGASRAPMPVAAAPVHTATPFPAAPAAAPAAVEPAPAPAAAAPANPAPVRMYRGRPY
jgi:hypothetical protein